VDGGLPGKFERYKERYRIMLKFLLVIGVVGFSAWFISQLLPDLQRYLKISSM
jgi:hypothetical protein